MRKTFIIAGAALLLAACEAAELPPQDAFMVHLNGLCGQSFEGAITSDDPQDADWRAETLTIHIRDCAMAEVKIPLHVGDDRSRTWIVSRTEDGLRLKHDHRHEDGEPDAVTMYGGDTITPGTDTSQNFPVDNESISLFEKEGLSASVTNVWSLTITPGERFTYSLAREGRYFEAEFDLTRPVPTPPPVWGYTP